MPRLWRPIWHLVAIQPWRFTTGCEPKRLVYSSNVHIHSAYILTGNILRTPQRALWQHTAEDLECTPMGPHLCPMVLPSPSAGSPFGIAPAMRSHVSSQTFQNHSTGMPASAKAQPCFKAVQGATQTYTGMQPLAGCGEVL